jgi:Ran GTPase-activating protein (RanGAP) involved in mRNA processing and transport
MGSQLLADALRKNSHLTYLDISGNRLGPAGAGVIAEALKANAVLTTLVMSENEIGASGAAPLTDLLVQTSTLRSLKLASNALGCKGAVILAMSLTSVQQSLTDLDISCNSIADEGALAVAKALQENPLLHTVNLRDNPISPDGAKELSRALVGRKVHSRADAKRI